MNYDFRGLIDYDLSGLINHDTINTVYEQLTMANLFPVPAIIAIILRYNGYLSSLKAIGLAATTPLVAMAMLAMGYNTR